MRRLWWLFFAIWPVVAILWAYLSPSNRWWFNMPAQSPMGQEIDNLFYLILYIVTFTFVGTNLALAYVLYRFGAGPERRSTFSHGSHLLEMVWTITPAGVLLFISLYQMDVLARNRIIDTFDKGAVAQPLAEVTARQFEWRIRYPHPTRTFKSKSEIEEWLKNPKPDDLYTVNDLHCPTNKPVLIHLRSEDVLHSFFIPDLRVKQDAVPGLVIPVWFEASNPSPAENGNDIICAELCGWGHYKMRGRLSAQPEHEFQKYLQELELSQVDDGVKPVAAEGTSEEETTE